MAVRDSHVHIVRFKRLAPCIVNLNSKQHLSVKRNSRSYNYVVVFRTKKGQTLQIVEAAPSSGGQSVLNEGSSTRRGQTGGTDTETAPARRHGAPEL